MTKELKTFSGKKKTAFFTNGAGSTADLHAEKCKLAHSYLLVQNSSPSRLKIYIKKPDTQKLIEEKVGTNLEHMGIGEKFLNRTPMAYV